MRSNSTVRLFGRFARLIQNFITEELNLAKAELAEKINRYGDASVKVAIGGVTAYAGFLVLLAGIGLLLSFVFQTFGLNLIPARALGFGVASLVALACGALLLLKAVKVLSKQSLAPDKTMQTIHRIQKSLPSPAQQTRKTPRPSRSAKELEAEVLATEARLGMALQQLAARTSPTRYVRGAAHEVQAHPYRWSMIAVATGFAGSILFVRQLRPSDR